MKHVFLLEHVRVDEGDDSKHVKTIGIYSSRARAEAAQERLRMKPGFADHQDGFNIDRYEIDKTFWVGGFG